MTTVHDHDISPWAILRPPVSLPTIHMLDGQESRCQIDIAYSPSQRMLPG